MVDFGDYAVASVSVTGVVGDTSSCNFGEYSVPVGLDFGAYDDGDVYLSSNVTRVTNGESVVREIWVYGSVHVGGSDGNTEITLRDFSCGERSRPNGVNTDGAYVSKSVYVGHPIIGQEQDDTLVFRTQEGCYDIVVSLEKGGKK
ncbi:hypothetical protein ACIS_00176 [Anaplasma centrale str. Israel]|uniref:Uncharacterized protein n=1 Tax=Anaplasma centrale (strain Israel) TaxID=574556 RepID=D1ATI2_ANACI|nr:hypothetical protein [Anaplasma centrale]ACZ48860.1 hypothetical protein ACIS_00176 [Anaplasma centrale str. Israel]